MSNRHAVRVGIDIGGTFTDFVYLASEHGEWKHFKLLSTPANPALAVLQGLEKIYTLLPVEDTTPLDVIHGSTVATNTLLERKGAKTALVTTSGFEDVLEIGRQDRPELYDLTSRKAPPLVPAEWRFGVHERVAADGQIVKPLDDFDINSLVTSLRQITIQSVAVCLLFSFLRPEHEQRIATALREAGWFVSTSSDVLPEFREYERTSTTVVNAYVSPVLDQYLNDLETATLNRRVHMRVMQSNGGVISLQEARRNGVRCVLSGPAGGIIGALKIGAQTSEMSNHRISSDSQPIKLISFDMGGTSTDVSLIDGSPRVTSESMVGGLPIGIPVLDIHTIGAGGGSIAADDLGGALRVGPQSAGADPGPACYGFGGQLPTVTDANLILGRLIPGEFLGGAMRLQVERAREAIALLGNRLELSVERTALGIVKIVNAHMTRALRAISVERGHDPRQFSLLSFGGAGGLHASDLARALSIPQVIIPPLASVLSAFGMLQSDIVKDYVRTVMLPGSTLSKDLDELFAPMLQNGRDSLLDEQVDPAYMLLEQSLDIRYRGQSYELTVPYIENFLAAFHALHAKTYGYAHEGVETQIVNLRLRAVGADHLPAFITLPLAGADPSAARMGERLVTFNDGAIDIPWFRGEMLQHGNELAGPCLVVRSDTTILLDVSDTAHIDGYGNMILDVGHK